MSKLVLHIVFFLLLQNVIAQDNLVPNGSFENYNWCPNTLNGYYINACKFWNTPTLGSPDYFNACSNEYDTSLQTYKYSVPQNYYGNQTAHSGNAYGAFVFGQNQVGETTYAEYVQIQLEQQLKPDRFYEVRFYIHNPKPNFCLNSVGALFTSTILNLNSDEIISTVPQIQSDPAIFFCDTNVWQEVKGVFLADGNENFLTIGVFQKTPQLKVCDYQGNVITDFFSVYMYIDDVSVKEIGLELSNIFTPNGDGNNDLLRFNSPLIELRELTVVNRWGNTVYQSDNLFEWNGTNKYDQKECVEGVYFFTLRTDYEVYHGHIQLIR